MHVVIVKDKHNGEIKEFRIHIVNIFKNDPMLHQVTEVVRIRPTAPVKRINTKEEKGGSRKKLCQNSKPFL